LFGTDQRVLALMETGLEAMKQAGAILVDVELKSSDTFGKSEVEVLLFEFKADLNAYLQGRAGAPVQSLDEVIRFNEENRARVMPFFGQERMEEAQKKGPLTSKRYLSALEKNLRLARKEGIDAAMRKHRVSTITMPSGGPAWLIDLVNGDGGRSWDMDSTSHAAVAGYPHITVPAGYMFGLPVGISFIGRPWQEGNLIRFAYAFEQMTRVRKPPRFLASVEVEQASASVR
jgi:amidase